MKHVPFRVAGSMQSRPVVQLKSAKTIKKWNSIVTEWFLFVEFIRHKTVVMATKLKLTSLVNIEMCYLATTD